MFDKIAALINGNQIVNLSITKKDNIISVLADVGDNEVPLVCSGTAEELNEKFFDTLSNYKTFVEEAFKSNIEEVKSAPAKAKASKPAPKKEVKPAAKEEEVEDDCNDECETEVEQVDHKAEAQKLFDAKKYEACINYIVANVPDHTELLNECKKQKDLEDLLS